jgi:hypothetical protein
MIHSLPLARISLFAILLCGFVPIHPLRASSHSIGETELLRRTQQLYDSLPMGDKPSWRWYNVDAMVYDEKGRA